jgi:predicted TIM-barrel fold metal-dependent hydrolase
MTANDVVATDDQLLGSWLFSTDDHLLEGSYTFEGRVPERYADRAPRIVEHQGGSAWLIADTVVPITFGDAAGSWEVENRPGLEARWAGTVNVYEDFAPSVYDVDARIDAMDRDGVWASVLIPSITFGFAGQRLSWVDDPDAGLSFVRAYNDWLAEEVQGAYPDRLIASQIPWYRDADVAATEIRRNAERGFKATLFAENPERLGFPSIHSGYWDPFFDACAETATVINLHLGTGLKPTRVSSDSPMTVLKASNAVNSSLSAFDWVFSGIAVRFPDLRVSFTEGGIDFVPLVYGRLETMTADTLEGLWDMSIRPEEVFARNFWFSALYDIGAFQFIAEYMPDHGMVETDFPHGDTQWPRSRAHFAQRLRHLTIEQKEKFLLTNASALYRHPLSDMPQPTVTARHPLGE